MGQGSSTAENDWTIYNAGAGTMGAAGMLQINKADASDLSRPLNGAEFELYKVDMSKLPAGAVSDKQVRDASKKVLDSTTNVDGIVTFGSPQSPLKTNVLYFFVETAAPTSYELDPSLHYVMLKGTDKDAYDAALKQAKDHGITPSANQTYNVYDKRKPAEAKATAQLYAQKKLDGRAWQDGDSFDFKLAAADNAPMPEGAANGELTKTVTDGNTFGFGEINYSQAGTYVYHISEVTPAQAQQIPGVSYSNELYTATVTVRDNGTGNLVASVKMDKTSGGKTEAVPNQDGHPTAVIANTYQPAPTTFAFGATKTLKGRALKDGEFRFELRDADGKTVETVKNSANGKVVFAPVTFDKAGEYTYTIREVAGKATGVAYDKTVYTAKVSVVDNLDGTMSATASYSSGLFGADHKAPAFENTYTPPLSETGSNTLSMGIAMILLLGGGLIMVLAQRKEAMGSRLGSQGRHSK